MSILEFSKVIQKCLVCLRNAQWCVEKDDSQAALKMLTGAGELAVRLNDEFPEHRDGFIRAGSGQTVIVHGPNGRLCFTSAHEAVWTLCNSVWLQLKKKHRPTPAAILEPVDQNYLRTRVDIERANLANEPTPMHQPPASTTDIQRAEFASPLRAKKVTWKRIADLWQQQTGDLCDELAMKQSCYRVKKAEKTREKASNV